MPSPLAFLAGLGAGASTLSTDMATQQLIRQQAQRQQATDALTRLATLTRLGFQPVPTGANPQDALSSLTNANALRSGGAIPNAALGIPDEATPNAFGTPALVSLPTDTGGSEQYLMDPSRTPEALAERRASMAQSAADRRQQEMIQGQNAREDAKEKAAAQRLAQEAAQKAAAQVIAAHADYNTLRATNPKHPLVQTPFDPNEAVNYNDALKFEQQKQLQASQYHPEGDWVASTAVDAQGQPILYNKKTGKLMSMEGATPGARGLGGASAQTQQARLLAAVSEARLADERMRAFEDKLLSGTARISPLEQAAGSLTTNLGDTHSALGALTQAASEFGLNKGDSEYAQYLRDAATIGRAEQMMSPRGGNETMVRANALLSRAGTGAMKNTIDASRMARQALFGVSGGIEQTLSPTQSAKLQQGLSAIRSGETGAAPTQQAGPTPAQLARAKTDPTYAAFLRAKGLIP